MGLTIHYKFAAESSDRDQAQRLMEDLHRAAGDLPFESVSDLVVLGDPEDDEEDPTVYWPRLQADYILLRGDDHYFVPPLEGIAFTANPGEGSESANFGLCRYPAIVEKEGKSVATGLSGWHWQTFCKTQYASDPREGGIENFLRCHLAIIRLLDRAKKLGILAEVHDEGEFWEHRDVAQLVETIGRWNRVIAGFVGRFKDQYGGDFVAPITGFPNFEHLEADDRRDEED